MISSVPSLFQMFPVGLEMLCVWFVEDVGRFSVQSERRPLIWLRLPVLVSGLPSSAPCINSTQTEFSDVPGTWVES